MSDWTPDTLWLVVTGRCNLRCEHCYLDLSHRSWNDLDTYHAILTLEQAAQHGIKKIVLTGGEPFLRNDIVMLLNKADEFGIRLERIETNGSYLNLNVVEAILAHGAELAVSIDGLKVHDRLRRMPKHHTRVLRAIKELVQRGGRVVAQTVLTRQTIDELPALQKILEEYGVWGWRVFPAVSLGSWTNQSAMKNTPSPEEELCAYQNILQRWLLSVRPFDLWLSSLLTQRRVSRHNLAKPRWVCDHAYYNVPHTCLISEAWSGPLLLPQVQPLL